MTSAMGPVIIPVTDLAAALALYQTLLGEPYANAPYYVGFRVGGQELGLDPNGHAKGMTGPVAYWEVEDIEASLQELLAAGASQQQPITNVGGGRRVASVADADGNAIGLMQSS